MKLSVLLDNAGSAGQNAVLGPCAQLWPGQSPGGALAPPNTAPQRAEGHGEGVPQPGTFQETGPPAARVAMPLVL